MLRFLSDNASALARLQACTYRNRFLCGKRAVEPENRFVALAKQTVTGATLTVDGGQIA